MNTFKLLSATKINDEEIKVTILNKKLNIRFVLTWFIDHQPCGGWDIKESCESLSPSFNKKVIDAINRGQDEDCELYMSLIEVFHHADCIKIENQS